MTYVVDTKKDQEDLISAENAFFVKQWFLLKDFLGRILCLHTVHPNRRDSYFIVIPSDASARNDGKNICDKEGIFDNKWWEVNSYKTNPSLACYIVQPDVDNICAAI